MANQIRPDAASAGISFRPYFLLATIAIAVAAAVGIFRPPGEGDALKNGEKFGRGYRDREDAPVPVAVKSAGRGDFQVFLNGLGTVTAQKTVVVKPRVDGELVRVHFSEGQMIKEGELLAEIDPRQFHIQLQQAQGQLTRDQALLQNAELDRERYQTLLAQDSIAAQQTAAQAALVKQYQGSVEMDQAQVENAKLQLAYAKVTAPISGRVGLRQVDQGNIVRANDANGLVVITQLQPIDVLFTLPEDKLPAAIRQWRANPDIKVEAYDRAGKTKLADGRLKAIDNQIDPSTGTVKLKAQFDNREQTLFANQFVNVRMCLETLKDAVQIPSAAVQHDSEGAYVFVADEISGVARQRRIVLGPVEGDKVVVAANLAAGEAVVVDGLDRLKADGRIDVAEKDGVAVAAKPELDGKPVNSVGKRDQRS